MNGFVLPRKGRFVPPDGYVGVAGVAKMLGMSQAMVRKRTQERLLPAPEKRGKFNVWPRATIAALVGKRIAKRERTVTKAVRPRVEQIRMVDPGGCRAFLGKLDSEVRGGVYRGWWR